MRAVHPGRRELEARKLSANALASALREPTGHIADILNGKRAVTVGTALKLGRYFGQNPRFWLNLQSNLQAVDSRQSDP